jgi:hypothetical protein
MFPGASWLLPPWTSSGGSDPWRLGRVVLFENQLQKRANFGASLSLRLLLIAFSGMTSLDVRCEHHFLFFYCVFKLVDYAFKLEAGSSEPFFVWGDNPRPRPKIATESGRATGRTLANFKIWPVRVVDKDLWPLPVFRTRSSSTSSSR